MNSRSTRLPFTENTHLWFSPNSKQANVFAGLPRHCSCRLGKASAGERPPSSEAPAAACFRSAERPTCRGARFTHSWLGQAAGDRLTGVLARALREKDSPADRITLRRCCWQITAVRVPHTRTQHLSRMSWLPSFSLNITFPPQKAKVPVLGGCFSPNLFCNPR